MATALLAGATGLVGRYLLDQLVGSSAYGRVVAVVRRPLVFEHPKLVEVVADFSALDQLAEPLRGDDAFCCLGTTLRRAGSREEFRAVDHGAVLAYAWAAKRGGARRFFGVSALGADPASRFFYNRVKGETELALGVLGFDTLGLFRPGLLLGPREEYRLGERLGSALLALAAPVLIGRLRRWRAVHAAVVARAMVRSAHNDSARGTLIVESDEIQRLGRPGGVLSASGN